MLVRKLLSEHYLLEEGQNTTRNIAVNLKYPTENLLLIIHKSGKIKAMKNFNEKDVRLFYRFLNHKFLTELRFLKKGHFPVFRIVKSENEFVRVCRQWNGKRNVYAGLRDRRKDLKNRQISVTLSGYKPLPWISIRLEKPGSPLRMRN